MVEKIVRQYSDHHPRYPGRIITVERVDVCLDIIRIYVDFEAWKSRHVLESYRYESTLEEAFAAL
jgi:hypothetical protein